MSKLLQVQYVFKRWLCSIIDFISKNKLLIFLSSLVAIVCYGYEIVNFTLSIDEEVASVYNISLSAWISQGRFGITLIKLIFGTNKIFPFWDTLISVILLIIAAILWCTVFSFAGGKNNTRKVSLNKIGLILFTVVFISFPVHAEYISFCTYNIEVSLGFIIAALSLQLITQWILYSKSKVYLISGIFALTLSISIYQSFLFLFFSGFCTYCVYFFSTSYDSAQYFSKREIMTIFLKFLLAIIAALVIYECISSFLKIFYPSTGYIEGFFQWGKGNYKIILNQLYKDIQSIVYGNRIFGGKFVMPTIGVGIIIAGFYFFRNKRQRFIIPLSIIGLLVSPFILSIVLGSPTPLRAQQTLPFMMGSVWCLFYYSIDKKFIRYITILIVAFAVVYQSQSIAKLFYGDHCRYQQDIALGNQIAYRIESLGVGEIPIQPVVYVGKHSQRLTKNIISSEVLGHSFFEWDNGNVYRIIAFMNTLGYNYNFPTKEQVDNAKEISKPMPSWPDINSVTCKNGVVIVKLSD